jgi:hypothetical protein
MVKRGLVMPEFLFEWCELRQTAHRLCVVAPREHAKSETFTVNGTAWESIYTPGLWTHVFSDTADQASEILDRICSVLEDVAPWMVDGLHTRNQTEAVFANWSRVTVAGARKRVRGKHPDRIVGDDVLDEEGTATALQRRKTERWWLGTVAGMAHPGTWRIVGRGTNRRRAWFEPTRIFLVGTPFHGGDLLMSMRGNPLYQFRRYSGEYDDANLPELGSLAVEVT